MLTSPAADDYNPWQSFLSINTCNRNNANKRDIQSIDKRALSTENGETKVCQVQDDNVNANTCQQQLRLLSQTYDLGLQVYKEEGDINQADVEEKYDNYPEQSEQKKTRCDIIIAIGPEVNEATSLHQNNSDNNIQYLQSASTNSLRRPEIFNEASNRVSSSDTDLSSRKMFHHDKPYSVSRTLSKSNHYNDIPANFSDKTSAIETSRYGNFVDEKYPRHTEDRTKFVVCNEDDAIEVASINVSSEAKKVSDSFSVYRERKHRDDDFVETNVSTESSIWSVTSDEIEEFVVIDWDRHEYAEHNAISNQLHTPKAYLTPSTSPVLDLSGLDGFRTAPSTPEFAEVEPNTVESGIHIFNNDLRDIVDEFFVVTDQSTNVSNPTQEGENFEIVTGSKEIVNSNVDCNEGTGKSKEDSKDVNGGRQCCKCGKAIKATHPPTKKTNYILDYKAPPKLKVQEGHTNTELTSESQQQKRQERDSSRLQLPTPPFISVDSLYYEADPQTGAANVIGRGSFGQVYKARFSDPNFYYLSIVVKEFNEEFSNSRDIIEEAQRLYYLQDTKYVPVCYGILCFNDPNCPPKYGIVQEYIGTGLTLEQMLWDQYQLPLEVWLSISFQCCEGLARFHEKGILLNDIKTNNIIMEFRHNSVKIKFIDFGLATDMRGKRYKNTKSLDSYVYLAPEVRKFGNWTNVASDIYSVGYMLGQLYNYTGLQVLGTISRLCMDRDPDMRLPVRGATSLIHDSIIKHGLDPGTLCLDV